MGKFINHEPASAFLNSIEDTTSTRRTSYAKLSACHDDSGSNSRM
jgi:hypothetical protein